VAPPRLSTAFGADAVRAELRRRLSTRGSSKRVAHALGVSISTLSKIAGGSLAPSEHVAEGLGFRRVIRFERVE
jgi:transcriptional regulator with XRE-family HTH domain